MTASLHVIEPSGPSARLAKGRSRSRSPLNPDTSPCIPTRTRSADHLVHAEDADTDTDLDTDAGAGADAEARDDSIPACLDQSRAAVQEKFQELEWLQRTRLQQGQRQEDQDGPWIRESDQEVKLRNRYLNVQPWKNNRIHLKVPEEHCDYINASPISLQCSKTGRTKCYIATQGPKDGQSNHIWRMIWHETTGPAAIVMLTQTTEAGRDKCFQYFPDHLEESLAISDDDEFGDGFAAHVKCLETTDDEKSRSNIRKLQLTVGEESRVVWHFLFGGWPDFGVPDSADRNALFELMRQSTEKNASLESPRIVHCSAGVGRSGTFIALDHLLGEMEQGVFDELLERPESDIIFDTVNHLREQRMMMVQSEAQLHYIYQVLKEKWLERIGRLGSEEAMEVDEPESSSTAAPAPDPATEAESRTADDNAAMAPGAAAQPSTRPSGGDTAGGDRGRAP